MKKCIGCHSEKNESDFYFNKSTGRVFSRCKECFKLYSSDCKQKNKEKTLETKRLYRAKNKGKKQYTESPEAMSRRRAKKVAYDRQKRQSDPVYRLKCNIRRLVRIHLKKHGYTKKSKTSEILGCDFETFKHHIELQFIGDMTWDMVGSEIQIDHIVPLATAKTEADVIKLNHYTNLRPMWSHENASKGSKVVFLI